MEGNSEGPPLSKKRKYEEKAESRNSLLALLAPDTFNLIFLNLEPKELAICKQVCKDWYAKCNNQLLWKLHYEKWKQNLIRRIIDRFLCIRIMSEPPEGMKRSFTDKDYEEVYEMFEQHLRCGTTHRSSEKVDRMKKFIQLAKDKSPVGWSAILLKRYISEYFKEAPDVDWKKALIRRLRMEKVFGNPVTKMKQWISTGHPSTPYYFHEAESGRSKCVFCKQTIKIESLRTNIRLVGKQTSYYVHASCDLWVRGTKDRGIILEVINWQPHHNLYDAFDLDEFIMKDQNIILDWIGNGMKPEDVPEKLGPKMTAESLQQMLTYTSTLKYKPKPK